MKNLLIIGNAAENSFVEDICHHLKQRIDYSDIISLKDFANREFCPRFIWEEPNSPQEVGSRLAGKTVLIVSTSGREYSRDELSMRTFLIARAAKDNGAEKVALLEPDLFYSAQDRGPRREHGLAGLPRSEEDCKKFDGQPFSSRLYAELLKSSGVDRVITVQNHSRGVEYLCRERFSGAFDNLLPYDLYASYILNTDVVNPGNLVICAPDRGAQPYADGLAAALTKQRPGLVLSPLRMKKDRKSEYEVTIEADPESPLPLESIQGKDVAVIDDMVRTGKTIVECCRLLKTAKPNRVVFFVTHFESSREGRINMADPSVDEIVTTSTIPSISNRDVQGRLRSKLVVLRLERWLANHILYRFCPDREPLGEPHYSEDISLKNPRWKGHPGPLFTQHWL
ncbi:MAG: ribose-phosphate pyrophosphokinase [Spirochaetales bacterium]|jgi:ribose-phosphate pyrophosphokinase|nr:ribose-phosphate pyrophosphokinase [Spirochaetales bacterium]